MHTHITTQILEILRRLTNTSLPLELLVQVIEAMVKSQIPHIFVDHSTSLQKVAEKVITDWPKDLDNKTRDLVYQLTTRAMLEHSVIKIPAKFTLQGTLIVPPALQ